jgi:hypothetical protein
MLLNERPEFSLWHSCRQIRSQGNRAPLRSLAAKSGHDSQPRTVLDTVFPLLHQLLDHLFHIRISQFGWSLTLIDGHIFYGTLKQREASPVIVLRHVTLLSEPCFKVFRMKGHS